MPAFVISDGAVWLGEDEVTPMIDGIADLGATVAMVERKRLDSGGFQHFLPGLNAARSKIKGACGYDASEPGTILTPATNGAQRNLTVIPQNGAGSAVGDIAVIHRGIVESVKMGTGEVGAISQFEANLRSDLVQAVGAVGAPMATRTTAGFTGAAVAMTGPGANRSMWCGLHVVAAAGTNLVVKLQSDNGAGFASPTDRITFATMSAKGWQFLGVAGDLSTETHWRITCTIASGTFRFGAAFGVA